MTFSKHVFMLKLCFQGPPGEPGQGGSPGRDGDMVTTPTLPHPREANNVLSSYVSVIPVEALIFR